MSAVETEEGRHWAESRIKALTGGDTIAARFMRQDYFEFAPQFKLVIAGNHKPGLKSVDEAIRRRFHLLPFSVTIPATERDPRLRDKLKAEWSGILAWLIEGCLQWQRYGLVAPGVVTDFTAAYLEAEDTISGWIEECCSCQPDAWSPSAILFACWKAWTEKTGEQTGTAKRFAQKLDGNGFALRRTSRGARL